MKSVLLFLVLLTAASLSAARRPRRKPLDITETIEKTNANLRKALTYGDIVSSSARNAAPCTAGECKWPKSSRFVYIPVALSKSYSTAEMNIIINALLSFHTTTCIRFVQRRWWHSNYIWFYSGSGCFSQLGFKRGGQSISLARRGCLRRGVVQHEVMHALGFHHEQNRSDRDRHVIIQFQNIMEGKEFNFRKVNTNNLATPYDLRSIMQYSNYAFSKNDQPTIVAKSNPNLNFGNSRAMTRNDIARINRLYQC